MSLFTTVVCTYPNTTITLPESHKFRSSTLATVFSPNCVLPKHIPFTRQQQIQTTAIIIPVAYLGLLENQHENRHCLLVKEKYNFLPVYRIPGFKDSSEIFCSQNKPMLILNWYIKKVETEIWRFKGGTFKIFKLVGQTFLKQMNH